MCPKVSKKYLNNFRHEIVKTEEIFYSVILVKGGQRFNKIKAKSEYILDSFVEIERLKDYNPIITKICSPIRRWLIAK